MLRGILTVGGWTMASRILGFVRDVLIADLLGAGPVADAFFVANRLPNLFRRLFGEGAFNAAFVPEFAGSLAAEGPAVARGFAEEAMALMAVWLAGLAILGELFMPAVVLVLAPGFHADAAKFALAVTLSRITFPYMPLICLTALLSGVLNGLDRFAAAAAAPILFNLTTIAFLLALAGFLPTPGHALAWGVTVSGVLQLGLLLHAVRKAGMGLALRRPRLSPRMRLLLARMAPGLFGAGVTQLNLTVDLIIASLLPSGTVSVLYYADRVNQLPLGVIGAAVGTALLPTLSRAVRGGETAAAMAAQNRGIEYALSLTLPAAIGLLMVGHAVIAVLFGRGAFDPRAALRAGQALSAYAVGLPAFVLVKALVPGFFARGDTATPVKIGTATVALNLVPNFAFMVPLQHLGPPLASGVAAWANVASLTLVLRRRGHFAIDARLARVVPRMLLAALAMAVALGAIDRLVYAPLAGQGVLRWLGLAALIGGGMLVYAAAGQLLGAFDAAALLRRRRGG
ncbi:MAG: murein biosynthesis integral membrane protein MurJ [Rhodospirillales bacterium]|nr:murein biosynthesis integral membrane protein MurJ [Rhodospirillales bacterium]